MRSDVIDESSFLCGTGAQDKKEAILTYIQITSRDNVGPLVTTFDGLDPKAMYQVTLVEELSVAHFIQKSAPGWWPSVEMTGEQLANLGLQLPVITPEQGLLFHFRAL